jgi:hypothetical protein
VVYYSKNHPSRERARGEKCALKKKRARVVRDKRMRAREEEDEG